MRLKKCLTLSILSFLAFFILGCEKQNQSDAMGIFQSDEVLVSSEIAGKITFFDIKEGDFLQKESLVAKIDTTQLELQIQSLNAQIASLNSQKIDIQSQLAPLQEEIKTAKQELERYTRLVSANATTRKNLDDANAKLLLLQKQLDSNTQTMTQNNENIDKQIVKLQIDIQIIQDKIQRASILAPINGIVLEKYAFVGELSSSAKPLFKLADLSTLRLKAYLIDTDITKLKIGDKVEVISDWGEDERVYEGVVSWISSSAEFSPKTIMTKDERKNLVYAIKVDVKNDGYLKIGSYAEVRLLQNSTQKGK